MNTGLGSQVLLCFLDALRQRGLDASANVVDLIPMPVLTHRMDRTAHIKDVHEVTGNLPVDLDRLVSPHLVNQEMQRISFG